jgi:ribonuclease BN (tRNA processing enzyme)
LLQTGESLSLIDCGGGVTQSFLRCHFNPMKLDRIFISHTHSDHCCELTLVIQMLHVLQSERRLDIYVPDEFVRPLLAWLNAVYLFPQHIRPDLHIHGYADQFVFNNNSFELTAMANRHLEKSSEIIEQYDLPNRMQCHSFRISTAGKKLLYSADLGSLEDISDHLDGLDYAIIESTHVDLESLFDPARQSPDLRIILTHLGSEEEVSRLHNQVNNTGLTNISIASDGLRLEL